MYRRSTILAAFAAALSLTPVLPAAALAMPMGGSFTGRVES